MCVVIFFSLIVTHCLILFFPLLIFFSLSLLLSLVFFFFSIFIYLSLQHTHTHLFANSLSFNIEKSVLNFISLSHRTSLSLSLKSRRSIPCSNFHVAPPIPVTLHFNFNPLRIVSHSVSLLWFYRSYDISCSFLLFGTSQMKSYWNPSSFMILNSSNYGKLCIGCII